MLTLRIKTDNEAFQGDAGTEIARILRRLAGDLDGRDILPGETFTLRDINGNRVGAASVTS